MTNKSISPELVKQIAEDDFTDWDVDNMDIDNVDSDRVTAQIATTEDKPWRL